MNESKNVLEFQKRNYKELHPVAVWRQKYIGTLLIFLFQQLSDSKSSITFMTKKPWRERCFFIYEASRYSVFHSCTTEYA